MKVPVSDMVRVPTATAPAACKASRARPPFTTTRSMALCGSLRVYFQFTCTPQQMAMRILRLTVMIVIRLMFMLLLWLMLHDADVGLVDGDNDWQIYSDVHACACVDANSDMI